MKISLRPLKESDKKLFYSWWNDMEIRRLTSKTTEIIGDKEVDGIIDDKIKDPNEVNFIIEADSKPIGHIFFGKEKRKKYYCVYVAIGEKDYWDKGFGTEALKIAIDWFWRNHPEEDVLELEVNTDNPRALRCYEKTGFERISEKKYKDNKDTILMRKLRST